jgi:hypothetical protein
MKPSAVFVLPFAILTSGAFAQTPTSPTPTFTKDVAPIFQAKCEECHRKDSMSPMSLVTFEEARPWAKSIRQRVITRQMPPWHIDRNVGVQKFKNDISLSDEQVETIVRWVDAGAPQGNPKDMPAARKWPTDNAWQAAKTLGEPDLVIKSEPYTMAAHRQDVWWRPTNDVPITEPRWVRAIEIRPGSLAGRRMTHHAVAYLDQDDPESLDSQAGRRGFLMEWAIGKAYDEYAAGTGKLLLPGSKVSWDIHLHAAGEEIRDHVELGVWLYPKGQEPKYRTYLTGFTGVPGNFAGKPGRMIDIPPNTLAETQGFTVLKQPARIDNFQPHMHLRGKAMAVEAILPDGTTKMLSYIGNFNFNWMTNYIYAEDAAPVLPKGTIIHVTAWHDNTRNNPSNPDPDQWVGYGDRTVDEMAHAWMNVTYVSDEDYEKWVAARRSEQQSAGQQNAQR